MDKKKIAAAMAAVTAFIKTEEAAAYQLAPAEMISEEKPFTPAVQMNLWGVSGRQALMQTNTMMQLRMFK
jgi:hypothetical protein